MLILGLSFFLHHTSAAILQDGVVRAAIVNHKLLRSSSQGLPNASIRFCLGATWSDLDVISIATRPGRAWLNQSLLHGRMAARVPLAGAYYEANEIDTLTRHLNELRMLRQKNGGGHKTIHFDHHLCHVAAAFFMSPFDRASILILDEDGDGDSGMIAIDEDKKIRVLRKLVIHNVVLSKASTMHILRPLLGGALRSRHVDVSCCKWAIAGKSNSDVHTSTTQRFYLFWESAVPNVIGAIILIWW